MIGILNAGYVTARLIAILPELEAITLYPMRADGTLSPTAAPWAYAKREEASLDAMMSAGISGTDRAIGFTLIDEVGTKTPPAIDDKLVDADSISWTIRHVNPRKLFKRIYRVTVVQNV